MLRLDDPIDRKRPTHLHLTIPAVAGMDKHGLRRERELNGTAEAGGGRREAGKILTNLPQLIYILGPG
jgi:hypothetical protein